jgi:hypothetical protein
LINIKTFIFILFAIILSHTVLGQTKPLFFNEISISLNKSSLPPPDLSQVPGFGFGVYRKSNDEKLFSFHFGFEFNKSKHFLRYTYEGRFAHAKDVLFKFQNISIPINLQLNFGKEVNFFMEMGVFADLIFKSQKQGTMYTYLPDQNNQISLKQSYFSGRSYISGLGYGPSVGAGIRLPIKDKHLIFKTDYRFGLKNHLDPDNFLYPRYLRFLAGFAF